MTLEKGDAIIRKGAALNHIYLVVEGSTQAHIMGRHLSAQSASASAKLKLGGDSGAWVGEMTFLDRLGEKERLKHTRAPKPAEQRKVEDEVRIEPGAEKEAEELKLTEEVEKRSEPIKENDDAIAPAQAKTNVVLYTVLAKENCVVWKWSFDDMEALMLSSMVRSLLACGIGNPCNWFSLVPHVTAAGPSWCSYTRHDVFDCRKSGKYDTESNRCDAPLVCLVK